MCVEPQRVNPVDWELSAPDLPDSDWIRAESAVELTMMDATPGAHSPQRLTRWLNAICMHHVGRSLDAAARLDPRLLLNSLVQAHESLRLEHVTLQFGARTGILPMSIRERIEAELFATVGRVVSLRLAVELHSARPAAGSEVPSRQILDELWARAFEIVRYGTASDLVHHGFLSPELVNGPCGLEPPADRLFDARSEEHAAALADELADPLSHALGLQRSVTTLTATELEREHSLAARLDAAFVARTGLPLSKMAKLVGQLACLAGFQPHEPPLTASLGGFNCASGETLVQVLSALLPGDPSAVRGALRFLSIGPWPSYPAKEDMAWVYGRRRSFQSRPMVRHPDGSTLSWSGVHTYLCLDVICSQLSYNSLPGVDDRCELGRAMGALSTWRGQVFQKEVLDVARADSGCAPSA